MNYTWRGDHRRKVREYAVSGVLAGTSSLGAAVLWNVRLAELKRPVHDARITGRSES